MSLDITQCHDRTVPELCQRPASTICGGRGLTGPQTNSSKGRRSERVLFTEDYW